MLKPLAIGVVGVGLGLWSADALLAHGGPFGVASVGPWRIASQAGAADADPYERAVLSRSGEIPIAIGEGLQLVARLDDAGRKLDGHCVYRVFPHAPAARYWTLGVVNGAGFPIDNPAHRTVFRSSEILRAGDGSFAIVVSPVAAPGNWLPVDGVGTFSLVLRLYDTPLSVAGDEIENSAAPTIERERCL